MAESQRSRQAHAIYALQMREAVIRMTTEGRTDAEIATYLGQSISTVKRYRDQARAIALGASRALEQVYDLRADLPPDPAARAKRGPGPGPHVRASWKHPRFPLDPSSSLPDRPTETAETPKRRPIPEAIAFSDRPADHGNRSEAEPTRSQRAVTVVDPTSVIDPPDVVALREQCLDLRKAMLTFGEIAKRLGISEPDARAHTAYALRHLQDSLTTNADMERRLMVEQIDDMIRAIRPQTVTTDDHEPTLEAIDRMLKLMDRKAKLLGLDQAESVDIMIRLQALAVEGNYDMVELMDLAKDTLSKHKIRMPMHLVAPPAADDDG